MFSARWGHPKSSARDALAPSKRARLCAHDPMARSPATLRDRAKAPKGLPANRRREPHTAAS
eukprot:8748577-Alexandrium_andersonii.AAC.1